MLKKLKNLVAVIILATVLCACAGTTGSGLSSAPPVDLPAPITGRVEMSEPDGDGNVTITGGSEAVTAGAMVMAVNEEIAGAVDASISKVFDLLIKSAYAETTFPDVCYEAGHACAIADEEGAFIIILQAQLGDSIVIGVIDPDTGEFISEVLREVIEEVEDDSANQIADTNSDDDGTSDDDDDTNSDGSDPVPDPTCPAAVDGTAVDVAVNPIDGTSIVLKEGDSNNTNRLILGTTPKISISISGCYANSLDVVENGAGLARIAVTSGIDKIIWTGTLTTEGALTQPQEKNIGFRPLGIKIKQGGDTAVIALKTSDSIVLADTPLSAIIMEDPVGISDPSTPDTMITGLTNVLSMDVLYMPDESRSLGLILASNGTQNGVYLAIFDADGMEIMDLVTPAVFIEQPVVTPKPQDAKFIVIKNANGNDYVGVSVLYNSGSHIRTIRPLDAQEALAIQYDINVFDFTYDTGGEWTWDYEPDFDYSPTDQGSDVSLVEIAYTDKVPFDEQARNILGITTDGYVWNSDINDGIASDPNGDLILDGTTQDPVDVGQPVKIAVDALLEKIFILDESSGNAIEVDWPLQ